MSRRPASGSAGPRLTDSPPHRHPRRGAITPPCQKAAVNHASSGSTAIRSARTTALTSRHPQSAPPVGATLVATHRQPPRRHRPPTQSPAANSAPGRDRRSLLQPKIRARRRSDLGRDPTTCRLRHLKADPHHLHQLVKRDRRRPPRTSPPSQRPPRTPAAPCPDATAQCRGSPASRTPSAP